MENSNTIEFNNKGDNNPMSSLSFHWKAIFSDGSVTEQFNEDGTENKFQLVKDRFNILVYFNLANKQGILFTVDLIHGIIGYNDLILPYRDFSTSEKKENIRLIFFRRHKVEMTENLIEKSHTITYHLGYQYLDKLGNNRQIVLQIDSEGNFIIES
jgi:hypothetical protein